MSRRGAASDNASLRQTVSRAGQAAEVGASRLCFIFGETGKEGSTETSLVIDYSGRCASGLLEKTVDSSPRDVYLRRKARKERQKRYAQIDQVG